MGNHILANRFKEITFKSNAFRNNILEVFPSMMDAYITIDPSNRSQYPSQNQNRALCAGCEHRHRLSTIRDADRIIVLENGRMIQLGDHDTLMKESGLHDNIPKSSYESGM